MNKALAAAFFALLFLCGCSAFHIEMRRPLPTQGAEFTEGQTRVGAVISRLGPPNTATKLPHGFAFLYEFSRVREFQLGVSLNVAVLRYFKFIHAWNRLHQETLLFT